MDKASAPAKNASMNLLKQFITASAESPTQVRLLAWAKLCGGREHLPKQFSVSENVSEVLGREYGRSTFKVGRAFTGVTEVQYMRNHRISNVLGVRFRPSPPIVSSSLLDSSGDP